MARRKKQGNPFNDATPNPERRRWRRRDNNNNPNPNDMAMGLGMGNFYYPGIPNAMPFPHPGHPDHASAPFQPYYPSSGPVWSTDRNYVAQPQGQVHPLMNDTRADELKDQEKRLFLEEYRYVGQQTQYEPPRISADVTEPTADLETDTAEVKTGTGDGIGAVDSGVEAEIETETGGDTGKGSTPFKLRGDAPEFVPMKEGTPEGQRQGSWTIVTSWY